jgi:hypothetical protein
MRVLVTGNRPTAGSWAIRAEQLARPAGFRVHPVTTDIGDADVVVAVKRHNPELPSICRRAGIPLVWDIIDPWPQPIGNLWDEQTAKAWLYAELKRIRPRLVLASTKRMAEDIKTLGFDAVCIYHHARSANPRQAAEKVRVVGYDGSPVQLGHWADIVRSQCAKRGWEFVTDGARYHEFDIVLGLRSHAGYAPRNWKSNVKLANAQAAGIPFIGSPEAGYLETRVPGCEKFATDESSLSQAFDALTPMESRARISAWMQAVANVVSVENIRRQYVGAIGSVLS